MANALWSPQRRLLPYCLDNLANRIAYQVRLRERDAMVAMLRDDLYAVR